MDSSELSYRRYFPLGLLLVGLVALFLFGVSYFVEIRIIVEKPRYGDVTGIVRTFWRAILGVTTIGSFLLGVYALVGDEEESDGPPTKVEIKGTGHDIDVYPSGPVTGQDDENGEKTNESEDDATSADPDDGGESSTTEERQSAK
jgi:fluoride ion exporter CrcB/FEX